MYKLWPRTFQPSISLISWQNSKIKIKTLYALEAFSKVDKQSSKHHKTKIKFWIHKCILKWAWVLSLQVSLLYELLMLLKTSLTKSKNLRYLVANVDPPQSWPINKNIIFEHVRLLMHSHWLPKSKAVFLCHYYMSWRSIGEAKPISQFHVQQGITLHVHPP